MLAFVLMFSFPLCFAFRNVKDMSVQSVVKELLETDPTKRLGSGRGGTGEIKQHSFFAGDKAAHNPSPIPASSFDLRVSSTLQDQTQPPVHVSLSLSLSLSPPL